MKGDEERIYWLGRYLAALNKAMEDQKKGDTLFERAKELDARGAPVNEIEAIVDQIEQLVTDFGQEETTCMKELIRLGDVPNIEKLRLGCETRSAQIDAFRSQVTTFKEGIRRRGT